MKPTQVITDLCIAINAVEGNVTNKYIKDNERVRKTLYDLMIDKANLMFLGVGMSATDPAVTLKQLDKAIKAAGWDDQHFIESGITLKIISD